MMFTLLGLMLRFAVGSRRAMQSREKLGFWYDGTREGKPLEL